MDDESKWEWRDPVDGTIHYFRDLVSVSLDIGDQSVLYLKYKHLNLINSLFSYFIGFDITSEDAECCLSSWITFQSTLF